MAEVLMEKLNYPYDYLAVEIAVKIQNILEPNEDNPPYEYIKEGETVMSEIINGNIIETSAIADLMARTLSKSLEYDYNAEGFIDLAEFTNDRLKWIRRYNMN
jgi:hypothetical protein